MVPVPLLPSRRGFRRAGAPHRTAAAATAASQTRRGAQGPAAPAARFLETLALSFGWLEAGSRGEVETPARGQQRDPGVGGVGEGGGARGRSARVRCGLY